MVSGEDSKPLAIKKCSQGSEGLSINGGTGFRGDRISKVRFSGGKSVFRRQRVPGDNNTIGFRGEK